LPEFFEILLRFQSGGKYLPKRYSSNMIYLQGGVLKKLYISLPDAVYDVLIEYCEAQSLGAVKIKPSRVISELLIQRFNIKDVDMSDLVQGGRRPGAGRPPKK
jgi:hypothetical protein